MTLGLCMIVKDEEEVLARCLESVKGVFDEIVVADTGSKDRSREIARAYGAKVYEFRWIDDFSAARNFSFSKASADYLMWLDADDILLPQDKEALLALKKTLDGSVDAYMLRYNAAEDEYGNTAMFYYRERILRRGAGFCWDGAVHETICVCGNVAGIPIAVTHRKPTRRGASARNLRIFAKYFAHGNLPDERQKFYFARELSDNGLYSIAADVFEHFLQGNGWTENKICACRDLAYCYKMLGRREKQRESLFKSFAYAPPRPEICCDLGALFLEDGDPNHAIFWYKLAANEKPEGENGAFVQPDYSGYIPYMWLCVCYDRLGKHEKARYYNDLAGELKPQDKNYLQNKLYFQKLFEDKG